MTIGLDSALKELARRLKKACPAPICGPPGRDDFLLVLPEVIWGEVQAVLSRIGALEMTCSGRKGDLATPTGWVDYQPGDLPADLLSRRATPSSLRKRRQREFLLDAGTPLSGCRHPSRLRRPRAGRHTCSGAPVSSCWGLQPPDRSAPGATLPLLIGVCNHTIRLWRAPPSTDRFLETPADQQEVSPSA